MICIVLGLALRDSIKERLWFGQMTMKVVPYRLGP
jgi:hypothetical protein